MQDIKTDALIALRCLDLTSLNDADTPEVIEALCAKAQGPHGKVAAVCVWPRFAAQARALLPETIKVAAVANFPDGALDVDRAVRDTSEILAAGGNEIDLVLPYRAFMAGQVPQAAALVAAVRRACEGHTLKLIIEAGELKTPELIAAASAIGLAEGADFLKTSTGKTAVSATPEAARIMLQAIAAHARSNTTGAVGPAGFKAAGGIRTVADAAVYIGLVREHLGDAAVAPARLRFGASGLLSDIEAVLSGTGTGAAPSSSVY
jgi:deoxyribose-phosphate aldolase